MSMRDRGLPLTIDDFIHVLDWADGRDYVDRYDIQSQLELALMHRLPDGKKAE
jgi:hypothetical protein